MITRNTQILYNDNASIKFIYSLEVIVFFITMLWIWWSPEDQIKMKLKNFYGFLLGICIIDGIIQIHAFTYMNIAYFIQVVNVSVFIVEMEPERYNVSVVIFYYIFNILHFFIKNNITLERFIMTGTIIVCIVSIWIIPAFYIQKKDETEQINLLNTDIKINMDKTDIQ